MSLNWVKHSLEDVPEEELDGSLRRKIVSGDQVMVVSIHVDAGHRVPRHAHVADQLSWVLEGALRFWVGQEEDVVDVVAGEALHIRSDVPHRVEALEDTYLLDIFGPPREELLAEAAAHRRAVEGSSA
jgi:quercetin dioxygenase-like cupin family protein